MENIKCKNGCCNIKRKDYVNSQSNIHKRYNKSGILIYDRDKHSVLLIQSMGKLWGIPKGTMEKGETYEQTARREFKEETGIEIKDTLLDTYYDITKNVRYFFVEKKESDINIDDCVLGETDVNAIGWIRLNCIEDSCIYEGFKLTNHCRKAFNYFLDF